MLLCVNGIIFHDCGNFQQATSITNIMGHGIGFKDSACFSLLTLVHFCGLRLYTCASLYAPGFLALCGAGVRAPCCGAYSLLSGWLGCLSVWFGCSHWASLVCEYSWSTCLRTFSAQTRSLLSLFLLQKLPQRLQLGCENSVVADDTAIRTDNWNDFHVMSEVLALTLHALGSELCASKIEWMEIPGMYAHVDIAPLPGCCILMMYCS